MNAPLSTDPDTALRPELETLLADAVAAEEAISAALTGREVEVISNFNDQPYGRSKPSLKGKRFKVKAAIVDTGWKRIDVWLDGCECAPTLWHDVKVVT